MNKPHKHADMIKAWADGAEIEVRSDSNDYWEVIKAPNWFNCLEYRIKPTPVITKKYSFCDRIERTLEDGIDLNTMRPQAWWDNDDKMEGKYLEWVFTDNKLTAVNVIGED